jgi:hypothetical protein
LKASVDRRLAATEKVFQLARVDAYERARKRDPSEDASLLETEVRPVQELNDQRHLVRKRKQTLVLNRSLLSLMEVVPKSEKFCFLLLRKAVPVDGSKTNVGRSDRSRRRHVAKGGGWAVFERNLGRSEFGLKNQSGIADVQLLQYRDPRTGYWN